MAELGDYPNFEASPVEIEWLDYEYVKNCTDIKKLKSILSVLKSGKEGIYVDLENFTEKRLLELLPPKERSKILRLKQKPTAEDISNAATDLEEWSKAIEKSDKKLKASKDNVDDDHLTTASTKSKLPPVRGTKISQELKGVENKFKIDNKSSKVCRNDTEAKPQRLSGYDFRAWEKFDADKAAAELDETETEAVKTSDTDFEQKQQEDFKRRQVLHEKELEKIRNEINSKRLTKIQIELRSSREKQKGNEHFRAGELENAFQCYTTSLALCENAMVYGNRAIVAIKLKNYEVAEDDCSRALVLDGNYLKGWYRRGMARFHQGKYASSIEDFTVALELDPDNTETQKLLKKAHDKYFDVEGRAYESPSRSHQAKSNSAPKVVSEIDTSLQIAVRLPFSAVDSLNVLAEYAGITDTDPIECGYYEIITSVEVKNDGNEEEEKFTRVAITEDDDEDEDEDGDGDNNGMGVDGYNHAQENASREKVDDNNQAAFTRVAITDDDEDEDDDCNQEESGVAMEGQQNYKQNCIERANEAKDRGNGLMAKGEYALAVDEYSTSIDLNPELTGAYNNRALAYISLKEFVKASDDCAIVLSREPDNMKALYRRALCFYNMKRFNDAECDIEALLGVDAKNEVAINLMNKITYERNTMTAVGGAKRNEEEVLVAKSEDSSGDSSETSWQWELEQLRKQCIGLLSNGEITQAIQVCLVSLALLDGHNAAFDHEQEELTRQKIATLTLLTRCYSRAESSHKSIEETCSKIICLDPHNFKAFISRAEARLKNGDLFGAGADAKAALLLDPSASDAMAILDEIEQVTAACDSQDDDTKTSKADGSAAKSSVNTTASDNEGVISTSAMYKSNELKDAGNEAMKQSQFDKAVQLYTQALELNICNAAARCNRSQAYLKLQRYIEAEADASAVLHEAMNNSNIRSTSEAPPAKSQARVLSELVKSDPMLTKALYRRGLARVNLDSKHWYGALDDFIALVIIDENNKVFIKERDRVAAMISQQRSKNTSKPSSERDLTVKPDVTSSRHKDAANVSVSSSQGLSKDKTAVKSSTETDLIGMKAVSTTRSKKVPSPSQLADGDSTSHNRHIDVSGDRNLTATTTPATSISSSPTNQSNEKKSLVKSNAGKSAKVINPEVPTEAPKTVYELERIWRGLKSNPERFAQYLSLFKKSTCKKVLKESVSPDLLSSLFLSLKDFSSSSVRLTLLEGISRISNFPIMLQLLPEHDLRNIVQIFDKLESDSDFAAIENDKIQELKLLFKIDEI